jgi:uncharacterized surface protein with fasciclin (FAS1) repeats
MLNGPGPYTLFAPTESAFEGIDIEPGLLTLVFLNHVVPGQVLSANITAGLQVETLQLENITFSFPASGGIFIDTLGSQVVQPDILASNGVVHKISGSLLVPQVVQDCTPPQVDSSVAANSTTLVPASTSNNFEDVMVSLVNLVSNQQQPFETLLSLSRLARLETPLSEYSVGLTVFAPIDDAFAALPTDLMQALQTEPYRLHLQELLLYHVVSGYLASADLLSNIYILRPGGDSRTSMNMAADQVRLSSTDGVTLTVNDADVIGFDVAVATDGLVHGIDAVLLPPFMTKTVFGVLADSPDFSTLASLLIESELEDVLAGPGPFTVFAPTNDAFSAELGAAWDLDVTTLKNILNFHVVAGMYPWTEIVDGLTLTTLQGGTITFSVNSDGDTFITIPTVEGDVRSLDIAMPVYSGGRICWSVPAPTICGASDILAVNGVIHQIGGVMLPPASTASPEVMAGIP